MSIDESDIVAVFDPASQGKSRLGHATLVVALEAAGVGLGLVASLVLEASIFRPALMACTGALAGFVGGMAFYSPREYRSVRLAIRDRDWRLLVYSVGDWLTPLVAGLGGLYAVVTLTGLG